MKKLKNLTSIILIIIFIIIASNSFKAQGINKTGNKGLNNITHPHIVSELPEGVKHTYYKYSSCFVLENGTFSQLNGMVDYSIWAETDIIEGEGWITISNRDYVDQATKKQVTLLVNGNSKITGKAIEGDLCTCYSLTLIYANGLSEKHPWLSYCERINGTPILYSSRLYASMVKQKWWQSKRKAKNEVWGEPYYNILGN